MVDSDPSDGSYPLPPSPSLLAKSLVDWFHAAARDLPWRTERSLYRTVVSEFMCQQTQIATVLPYFERWMEVFPDFEHLARAGDEQVMALWAGLGYYSRALRLRDLARVISPYDEVPRDAASWEKFPGVGPYTAAAITSIAFDTPSVVIDGNVIRILTRLAGIDEQFSSNQEAAKRVRDLAESLLPSEKPGVFNEAMMELGATVCTRHHPQCLLCPWTEACQARISGTQKELPRFAPRKTRELFWTRYLIQDGNRLLLGRGTLPVGNLLGLWELPLDSWLPAVPGDR